MATYLIRRPNGNTYQGSDRFSVGDYEPGQARLSDSQKKSIIRAIDAGEMTGREIATQWQVSERTVTRIARQFGRPPKVTPRNSTEKEIAEAARMWFDPAVSLQAIANHLHVVKGEARGVLTRSGYELPNRAKLHAKPRNHNPLYNTKRTIAAKEKFIKNAKLRAQGVSWKEIAPDRPVSARTCHYEMKRLHPDWAKEALDD